MQRRPRVAASAPRSLDVAIEVPPAPGPLPPIPWIAAASSVLGGAIVATLFSPVLAVLAGLSAVTVLGRAVAGRRTVRRATRERADAIDRGTSEVLRALEAWRDEERDRRLGLDRGPGADAVLGGAMPWQCEIDPTDPLPLVVGVGRVEVAAPPHGIAEPELARHVPARLVLDGAPIEIAVGPGEGLAICGDREDVLATAWSALGDLCRQFGPSSVELLIVTTADRLRDWDWCKWFPHLRAAAVGADEADAVLSSIVGTAASHRRSGGPAERPVMVVVDGVEPTRAGPLARVLAGRSVTTRVIWTGGVDDVPAVCVSTACVSADDRVEVTSVLGDPPMVGRSMPTSLSRIERIARCLGAFDDPLLDGAETSLPAELVVASVFDDEATRSEVWRRADRCALRSVIGADVDGALELDLVADGPHMLVAGTTGAGKSEFLRTLVLGAAWAQPPELASFLLIDFKGGGAFDLVSGLPHVAAVVTDLDDASAERALRALRAELRSREERLRVLGVSDIADVPHPEPSLADPLPRLLIVVDEFASMADELPDFLDELVDVARRGRSLGVHLVLATQRPAGVVTGQIRSNTNLRVCLRVQDRNDSIDVIGRPDASSLPPCPGRAVLQRGGQTTQVQVARVSGEPTTGRVVPFVLHPAMFEAEPDRADAYRRAIAQLARTHDQSGPPPLGLGERIDACARAATTRARPPWLDPIRSVDLGEVSDALPCAGGSKLVALGWFDDPDQRRRLPLGWNPAETGLLVVGADRGEVEQTIDIALAGVFGRRPETHVFVFDGGGGLADLESIDGVAAVVGAAEGDRMIKALRRLECDISAGVPVCVIVHRWSAVSDALDAEAGLDGRVALERLVREAADRGIVSIATGADERDVPGRVAGRLSTRVVHRLATPSAYLALDVRPAAANDLGPRQIVEPTTNRIGMIGVVDRSLVAERSKPSVIPRRVAVLGDRVERTSIAAFASSDAVVIGLDDDLDPAAITWRSDRPVVVLGLPGSGRTTAVDTLLAGCVDDEPVVIDDAERVTSADGEAMIAAASEAGRRLVVAATPAAARGFASWIAPLLDTATVVLLNPSRSDGEACRIVVPDLRNAPRGRAVVCDRGRTSIVQVAA